MPLTQNTKSVNLPLLINQKNSVYFFEIRLTFIYCLYMAYISINKVHRNEFVKLIKIVKDKLWMNSKTLNEENVIQKYVDISILCSKMISLMSYTVPMYWALMPAFDMIFEAFTKEADESVTAKLPVIPLWPVKLDSFKDPTYVLEYLLQIISCMCCCHGLLATSVVFFYLVFNTCGQFKIMQERLLNIITENDANIDAEEVERTVNGCIEFHQDLLLFCARMKQVFEVPLFAEIFMLPIFLCTSGYIAIMFPDNYLLLMFSGALVTSALIESLVHCVPATILTTEGLNVAYAAYQSNWYTAPLHVQKQILFIIARSQRPFYLTGAKITIVSVETFEWITRTAASYFTLLSSLRE